LRNDSAEAVLGGQGLAKLIFLARPAFWSRCRITW